MNDRMIEGMNNPYINSVDDGVQKEEEEVLRKQEKEAEKEKLKEHLELARLDSKRKRVVGAADAVPLWSGAPPRHAGHDRHLHTSRRCSRRIRRDPA